MEAILGYGKYTVIDQGVAVLFVVEPCFAANAIITVQPEVGTHPDKPPGVLEYTVHFFIGQSLFDTDTFKSQAGLGRAVLLQREKEEKEYAGLIIHLLKLKNPDQ